jgi:hypothetical protein
MSLRDLGVFSPLFADHPIIKDGLPCWVCNYALLVGDRVALMPTETPDQNGGDLSVEARPVHATCFFRGREIMTPKGRRIVEYIKSGDGSFFPVETTGGEEWRDEDVWCV